MNLERVNGTNDNVSNDAASSVQGYELLGSEGGPDALDQVHAMLTCIGASLTLGQSDAIREVANQYSYNTLNWKEWLTLQEMSPSDTAMINRASSCTKTNSLVRLTTAIFDYVVRPSVDNASFPRDHIFDRLRNEIIYRQEIPRPSEPPSMKKRKHDK